MIDDPKFPRWAVTAAVLVLGGLFAFMSYAAFVVPKIQPASRAAVPADRQDAPAPSLRLHTPTPDPYEAGLADGIEAIVFEIQVINTGAQIADYRDPAWQSMMTDSATSLQRACNKLKNLDPPVHLVAVHGSVRNMADHFIRGAQIMLKDYGHINGQTLNAVRSEEHTS